MRKIVAAAFAAAALLVMPSVAHADYWLTEGQAQMYAEDYAMQHYSSEYPGTACRPQGYSRSERGYSYHRWVCWWADEYKCEGKLLIVGSRPRHRYYAKVLSGQRCP